MVNSLYFMRSTSKDFLLWLFWLAASSVISVAAIAYWIRVNSDSNSTNDYTDQTRITFAIIALFLIALLINIINTIKIKWEFANVNPSGADSSLFKQHLKNLEKAATKSLQFDQDFLLEIIENRLSRKENWVQLFASLLITLGMIGTLLGLTLSMSGLSEAIDGIRANMQSTDIAEPPNMTASLSGLGNALSGMSSAFITTLAGAVLGGLFLKILSHSTNNLIEDLLDNIRFVTELEYLPKLQKQAWQRELENLSTANRDLKMFVDKSQQIDFLLNKYTDNMMQASEGMNSLTKSLEMRITRHIEKLSQSVNISHHDKLLIDLNKTVIGLNRLTALLVFFIIVLVAAFIVGFVVLYQAYL
ncbi:MAG: MotA/TolQ/ExbB proton channel family protein [Symploca sp. SIO3E6]|nr:MotA/TolQ/ExbB proton channel family protein [Caldora sp. SIO3E6]